MAKLTAWLVTLAGILLIPPITAAIPSPNWIIAAIVLIIGIGKLMRSYKK